MLPSAALLNLIDAYGQALPPPKGDAFKKKTERTTIKVQFDKLTKMVEGHLKSCLPRDIKGNVHLDLSFISGMLRIHRNEAGHPTGKHRAEIKLTRILIAANCCDR